VLQSFSGPRVPSYGCLGGAGCGRERTVAGCLGLVKVAGRLASCCPKACVTVALFVWAASVAEAAVSWLWWESCCVVEAAVMKVGRLARQLLTGCVLCKRL
jgi:hypothetical protein